MTRPSTSEAPPLQDPPVAQAANPARTRPHALFLRGQVGLVILGALTLVWMASWVEIPEQARGFQDSTFRHPSRDHLQPITDLRVAALDRAVPVFEPNRNIFAFASQPVITRRSDVKDLRGQDVEQGGKTRQPSPQDSALDVSFLGVFGPERLRIAVLEGKSGQGVANIREHDLLDQRYRVLNIDPKAILLHDTLSPDQPPIRVELPDGSSTL